jgi:EmrB/QacA subfamily drug resistance transporter
VSDDAVPARATVRYATPAARWILLATVLGSGIAFIDSTVVNIALPHIGRDLGATTAGLQWTVNAYVLSLASFILLAGSLGDRFGRRRVFVIGVVWFAVASLACGLAPTTGVLVAARLLQGIGAALLTPGSLAIIQASFHPDDRPRAIGAWAGLGGIAGVVGPLLGGWIVEVASWRWVFFINLPIAVAIVAVTLRHVPESADDDAAPHLDVLGSILGAVGLAGLTLGLTAWPERGPSDPLVAGAIAVGVLAMAAFVLVEARSRYPMLPLGLFRAPAFSATQVETFLVYAALAGFSFFVTVTLQVVSGYSPLAAGMAALPVTLLLIAFSSRAGALGARIGPRLPMGVGPLICAVGAVLLAGIDAEAPYLTDVFPGVLLVGIGLVLVVAPLTSTALASAPDRLAGTASGVNNAVARAAALLAIAVLPLVAGVGTDLTDAAALAPAHQVAMLVCAALLAAGGAVGLAFIPSSVDEVRAQCVLVDEPRRSR